MPLDPSAPVDRRMPALLDRLLDCGREGGPGRHQTDRRWSDDWSHGVSHLGTSMRDITALLAKDVQALLGARARPADDPVYQYPRIAASVVNFGINLPYGETISGDAIGHAEDAIIAALRAFEPRIVPDSLSVRCEGTDHRAHDYAMAFEIRCDVCPLPLAESLYIRTVIDSEAGVCEVTEARGG